MLTIHDFPPIFDEIDARFHVRGKPIIFAFGDRIFNPTGIALTPHLMAHEAVHSRRQGGDIVGWWRRYIDDPQFRLEEEIPAHRVEYRSMIAAAAFGVGNRHERRSVMSHAAIDVGVKLASPLYGRLVGRGRAIQLVKEAA
mgnify:CR=1 FL=1